MKVDEAMSILRYELQQKPELVTVFHVIQHALNGKEPLEWVSLTRDDYLEVLAKLDPQTKRLPPGFATFAEAIEEKSREKNFKGVA